MTGGPSCHSTAFSESKREALLRSLVRAVFPKLLPTQASVLGTVCPRAEHEVEILAAGRKAFVK